jgi:DNA-directed RNA polymerase beta' subunit
MFKIELIISTLYGVLIESTFCVEREEEKDYNRRPKRIYLKIDAIHFRYMKTIASEWASVLEVVRKKNLERVQMSRKNTCRELPSFRVLCCTYTFTSAR